MNQSHQNANWNCNSLLQSNKPSFNPIATKISKKVGKTVNDPGRPGGQRHYIIRPVFRRAYNDMPILLPEEYVMREIESIASTVIDLMDSTFVIL
jgi:hypothetical protein